MEKKSGVLSFLIVGISILLLHNALAMDIPVLKDVQLDSAVKFDKDKKLYRYSYTISNPSSNTGQISRIEVDISRPPQSQELSPEGLIIQQGIDRDGKMLTVLFNEELASYGSLLKKIMVPVGVTPPSGWSGGITTGGTVDWGSDEKKYRIMPGQSFGGFIIVSPGIPTIREIIVEPKWVLVVEGYVSEEDEKKAKEIEEQIAFKGKTLGPTAPPLDFNPLDFLNYIISMKHEASSLGWITNKGIEQSLDAKLSAARKKLEKGDTETAKNILSAFINEVEAQGCESYEGGSAPCPKGKHLTPEAYALLKYNAMYLIERL